MNLTFATRAIGAARLALSANAPTLMVAGGIVSMGAAVVTASKQTLKVEEIFEKHTPNLMKIEQGEKMSLRSYTKDDARGDRFKVYAACGIDLTKHYAVPGVLFFGGAALVFGGHRIMLKRNAALALAFTTVQNAFAKYRENAAKAMGPEFDRAMLKGFVTKEVLNEETGKVETVSALDWEGEDGDPYNRVFQQGESDMWQPDLGINKDFLTIQQKYAQERLNNQTFLYLSDVYKALGFQESPISRLVGWKITRLPDGTKDIPMIDFGLDTPMPDDWKYNRERAVYLDFNCQGLIIGGDVQKMLEKL